MGRLIFILYVLSCFNCSSQEINKLIWVKTGKTTIGNTIQEDAQPIFSIKVGGFWMQEKEVSNKEFILFTTQTGYKTLAERNGGSYVFNPSMDEDSLTLSNVPWWKFMPESNWKHPNGIESTIEDLDDFPVVHIAFEDACAYCNWLGMRLPTEVEREYASKLNDEIEMNNWQGVFPGSNQLNDGYFYTAPCGSFLPGKLGIYDLKGNVWEWCQDPYHQFAYQYVKIGKTISSEPLVPSFYDLASPKEETRVIRGGSFLCSENYCNGYDPSIRMRSSVKMTFSHIGFRCVKSKKQ